MTGSLNLFTCNNQTEGNLKTNNSGNGLDLSAACIVSESSRHPHSLKRNFTFSGQNGIEFVKNSLVYSILRENFTVCETAELTAFFPPKLEKLLSNCVIPFLYGWDRSIPLLDTLTRSSSDFFASHLIRCKNDAEIDAKFPMRHEGEAKFATLECKNYAHDLHHGDLLSILTKALKHLNSPLNLIFTQRAVQKTQCTEAEKDIDAFDKNNLLKLCANRKINFYRVIQIAHLAYEFIPFDTTLEYDNPKLTCLLFELERISFRDDDSFEILKRYYDLKASRPESRI